MKALLDQLGEIEQDVLGGRLDGPSAVARLREFRQRAWRHPEWDASREERRGEQCEQCGSTVHLVLHPTWKPDPVVDHITRLGLERGFNWDAHMNQRMQEEGIAAIPLGPERRRLGVFRKEYELARLLAVGIEAAKAGIEDSRRYLSLADTMTLCRKCRNRWKFKSERLCPHCQEHWMAIGDSACAACAPSQNSARPAC